MIEPENGNVRFLFNADPTADRGELLKQGIKYYLPNIELFGMRLICSYIKEVAVTVTFYRAERGESPMSVASSVSLSNAEEMAMEQQRINQNLLGILANQKKQTEYILTLIGGDSYRLSDDDVNDTDSI